MGRRNKRNIQAKILNNAIFMDYYTRLQELALNVFKWENLPDSIDERYLELNLFERGYCLFFEDEVLEKKLCLPCTLTGNRDLYDIPMRRRAYANNGYSKECDNKNSVIIYNNYLRIPTSNNVAIHSMKLYEIDRTITTNVKSQKTPLLILCSEQQRLTLENMYEQYEGNLPAIFGDKNLDLSGFQVLKTDSPFLVDRLQIARNMEWNSALTDLGIENSTQDKKERLVSDEVGANYGNIEAQRNVMLNARKQACEQINKMFNLNINVRFRSELETMVNKQNIELIGGDDYGKLYDSSQNDN